MESSDFFCLVLRIISLLYACDIVRVIEGSVRIVQPEVESVWLRTGVEIRFMCVSTHGEPMSWYHDDRLLRHNHRRAIINQPVNSRNQCISELHLAHVREADSGVISCRNRNHPVERDDVTLFVTNNNHIPTVEIIQPDSSVLRKAPGDDFMLKCTGRQGERLEWLHNGTVLQTGSKLIITTANTGNHQQATLMSRLSARAHDAGRYECRSHSNALDKDVVQVVIDSQQSSAANAGVEITQPGTPQHYAAVGTSLHIKCSASRATQVRWFLNDVRIRNGERGFKVTESFDEVTERWISILSRSGLEQDAVFKCQNVHNTLDYDVIEIRVKSNNPLENPGSLYERIRASPLLVEMTMHRNLVLQCSIGSSGSYVPQWTKYNQTIHQSHKYSVSRGHQSSTLTIKHTGRSDAGIYQCSFLHASSGKIMAAIVYNVTGILCPPLEPSQSYRVVGCPAVQYVGERCSIMCTEGSTYNTSRHGSLTCTYDEARAIAYWSDSRQICDAKSQEPGSEGEIASSLSHVLLRANENLRLQCGHLRVEWVKSSSHGVLQNGTKYSIENGTLVIKNAGAGDAGLYTCKLYSHYGVVFGHKNYNVTAMPCPRIRPPSRGYVTGCSHDAVYGETCQYTCHVGTKHVSGSRSATCELNDAQTHTYWTGDTPVCEGTSRRSSFQEDQVPAATGTVPERGILLWTALLLAFYVYS